MSAEDLNELEARVKRGEPITDAEVLQLVRDTRTLERHLNGMDADYNTLCVQMQALRSHVSGFRNRLGYVRLQLQKEAKFLPRVNTDNNRFYRALDTLSEIIDQI